MKSLDRISDEDLELLFAYLDGELAEEAALDFERRLADDPELAERCEELARTDERYRRLHERPARGFVPLTWLAAAAAVVLALTAWWLRGPEPLGLQVAVLPGDATLTEFQARIGHPGLVAPDERGGEGDPEQEAKLDILREALDRQRDVALASGQARTSAGYYYVALEIEKPAYVLLIEFPQPGSPRVLPQPAGALTHLSKAGVHLLPQEPLPESIEGRVFQYGYLLPLGVRRVEVLGALRAHIDTADLQVIRERFAATDPRELRSWLEARGYRCFALKIEAP